MNDLKFALRQDLNIPLLATEVWSIFRASPTTQAAEVSVMIPAE